jgi:hypothetical protein
VISDEGGFDELPEFFWASASFNSNSEILFSRQRMVFFHFGNTFQ